MPMANMSSVTGTMTIFSPRLRSGKALQLSASGPAEERLHGAEKNNGGEQETERGNGRERRRDGEGAFEDEKFADESVQPGQAERGKHGDAHPAAEQRRSLHQPAEIVDAAQAAPLFEQSDKIEQRGRSDAVVEDLHEDAAQSGLRVDQRRRRMCAVTAKRPSMQ